MTASQRTATIEMCEAILQCDCAPPDIQRRARLLQIRLAFTGAFDSLFGV